MGAVLASLLTTIGVTSASTQDPPAEVIALGGPSAMHAQALGRVAEATGAAPVLLGAGGLDSAVAISQRRLPDGAAVVVLASGRDFADALAAAPLLTASRTALLLVDPDGIPDGVAAELVRLSPDTVVVLGGPAAVGEAVLEQAAELTGRRPTRLAGADRYATAAAVSLTAHPDGADTAFLASGQGWADAVAAASAVGAHDGALLLTPHGFLPDATAAELVRLGPTEVIILGGPAAISDAVLAHIGDIAGVAPSRLAGPTRYETAEVIGRHARPAGAAAVYAATGHDWVDALSAGAALAADDATLLLVDTTVRWPAPDLAGAVEVAEARAGHMSMAVIGTDGILAGHLADRPVAAASTLKVMFMAAYLRQPSVRDRDLVDHDLAMLEPMITASANEPASRIAHDLGPGPLVELAAEVGMHDFSWTRPWGNSRTSARDMARLMFDLEQLLPERHRAYAMDLLTRIVPEQRWGVGQLDLPGWRVHLKGGWGSGTGSVDHQVVLLEHEHGGRVALAVMTTSSPSHDYATDTLQAVFAELLTTLP